MASEDVFRLANIVLERAGRTLIDRLSLALEPGSKHVLIGPNGAGKSLTLRLLQGLIPPDQGRIERPSGAAGRSAIVMQRPVLLRRSVRANLIHALKVYDVPASRRSALLEKLLETGNLTGHAQSPARLLSGGEQQRLCFVRALASSPSLLLLDEPTASLDPHSTLMIEQLIDQAAASGITTVLVTHDQGQARRVADRIIFMDGGRKQEEAPAAQFFAAPASAAARAYLNGEIHIERTQTPS